MPRYLVIAHRTVASPQLMAHVRALRDEGPCRFHLLVPVEHPMGAWSDGQVRAAASRTLQQGLDRFNEERIIADGEIGDANPVYAAGVVLRRKGPTPSPASSSPPSRPARRGGCTSTFRAACARPSPSSTSPTWWPSRSTSTPESIRRVRGSSVHSDPS